MCNQNAGKLSGYLQYILLALFAFLWWRHAWVSHEALTTFHQILHFNAGDGIVWSLGERVQAFASPLWFGLLSFVTAFTGEMFRTTLAVSFLCSAAAYGLLLHRTHGALALLAAGALLCSQAFIDFTSSGLETPLAALLLVLIVMRLTPLPLGEVGEGTEPGECKTSVDAPSPASLRSATSPNGRGVFFFIALLCLTRLDLALLVLPFAALAWHRQSYSLRVVAPALALLALWYGFAWFYFGHPLPAPLLATFTADLPMGQAWLHCENYLAYSWQHDPVTLVIIAAGIVLPLIWQQEETATLSLGLVLYGVWLAFIGGDFMGGRLFAAPVLMAVLALARLPLPVPQAGLAAALVALLLAIAPYTPFATQPLQPNRIIENGVADERAYYAPGYMLLAEDIAWPEIPQQVEDTHTSPYLVRMPARRVADWRAGLQERTLPTDFLPWQEGTVHTLPDAALNAYFSDIRTVTHAPLFAAERLAALLRLTTQHYDVKWAEYTALNAPPLYSIESLLKEGD